jgi:hypothetical protein
MSMREDLAEWRDWDVAAHSYGLAVGVFDGATARQVRRVVLSDNSLGSGLHAGVLALVEAGVLERREEPDEQFRWVFGGPESLPGALEAGEVDARPTALDLPHLDDTSRDDETGDAADRSEESGRPWWRRR